MKSYDTINPTTKKYLIKCQNKDEYVKKAEKFVLKREEYYFKKKKKITLTNLCQQFLNRQKEKIYTAEYIAQILKKNGIKVRKILEIDYFN